MGTWGAGPFENDSAADVVDTLEDLSARKRAAHVDGLLQAVLTDEAPLDADVAMEGVAAVGVVVASVLPGLGLLDPDVIDGTAVTVDDSRWAIARAAVSRLLQEPNELSDLWDEVGAGDEHAATLRALADALAAPRPRRKVGERIRRAAAGRRRAREEQHAGDESERRPDAVHVVAGPGPTVHAVAVALDEWPAYTLIPLAPGALPDPSTLTMSSGNASMTRATAFDFADLPLYDGSAASVEAALRRPLDVTPELAEWVAQTVELADVVGEPAPRWA